MTGVTLKLWCYGKSPVSPRACCTLDAIDDARRSPRRMGFPHFVVEAEEVFRERVLQPFLDALRERPHALSVRARATSSLKFGDLVHAHGADRRRRARDRPLRACRDARRRHRAVCSAPRDRRRRTSRTRSRRFPTRAARACAFRSATLDKAAVRAHAERLGLSVWDKPESQDLCFVPDGDYAGFMTRNLGETRGTQPGAFLDRRGPARSARIAASSTTRSASGAGSGSRRPSRST